VAPVTAAVDDVYVLSVSAAAQPSYHYARVGNAPAVGERGYEQHQRTKLSNVTMAALCHSNDGIG